MLRGDGTEFRRSSNKEMKYSSRVDEKNGSQSCWFTSYGHYNVKNGSFFVISADNSKNWLTVSASERSYLALLENPMYSRILRYH